MNEEIVRNLIEFNRNFKYIVKTLVVQKKGSEDGPQGSGNTGELSMSANCFWNKSTDGMIVFPYDDNEHMIIYVTLFGCAL